MIPKLFIFFLLSDTCFAILYCIFEKNKYFLLTNTFFSYIIQTYKRKIFFLIIIYV
nr:MAG TPA: hypothetical protein [Caudoviricetes sp.]